MTALTTRQRDLLKAIMIADAPMGADELARKLNLTPRQVYYGLKGVEQWLHLRDIQLEIKPGVGISLQASQKQIETLWHDLSSSDYLQLILSAEERHQLLALYLLTTHNPLSLAEIEQLTQVSRTTAIKDLDAIEAWYNEHGAIIARRPNYGIEVEATENLRQKLVTMLLWGNSPFGMPLVKINLTQGLVFTLQKDASLHPLVDLCDQILKKWVLDRVFAQIAYAEVQLGGRFTDDAFLHLALVFAIQTDRVSQGYHLPISEEQIQELKQIPTWKVAKLMAQRLGWELPPATKDQDIAGIAMWLLSAPRNENLPGGVEAGFNGLIEELMENIANQYSSPDMGTDLTLQRGLKTHVIPACLRQKYNIWHPFPYTDFSFSDKYAYEYEIAKKLADLIAEKTTYSLPETEINNIAALLRAARIRLRPNLFRQVLVVCPGGMASAQLLMSRLGARFPHLGPLKVISMRQLTDDQIAPADLIISTVPLSEDIQQKIPVLHVHPLLLAEDVETITRFIT